MELFKQILNWVAAIAWPVVILIIALIYRKPIYSLLSHIGGIAGRAATQPFELSLGENFKIAFKEALIAKEPKTVDEAISIAAEIVGDSLPLYSMLKDIPLTGKQREVLSEFVTPAGTGVIRDVNEIVGKHSEEDIAYLIERGLIGEIAAGKLGFRHSLIAAFVARLLYSTPMSLTVK